MSDTEKISFARSLRSQWRDEEEEISIESFEYTKRNTSLIEYLASIASEDYQINVSTKLNNYQGYITSIGTNYFSISHSYMSNNFAITSFPLTNLDQFSIAIGKKRKEQNSSNYQVNILQKSFKALLDEISSSKVNLTIELITNNEIKGYIDLYKDFYSVRIMENTRITNLEKISFIEEGSTLIYQDSIISITQIEKI